MLHVISRVNRFIQFFTLWGLFFSVIIVVPQIGALESNQDIWKNLKHGPYAIGYQVKHVYDYSRSFVPKMDYLGNGQALGQFAPLIIRLERKDSKTVIFSVTQNGVTQTFTDDEPSNQPKKIDAMAINFPNPRAFRKVVLAKTVDWEK